MPKTYRVGDTEYHFPDNFTDEQAQRILTEQGVIKAAEKSWADKLGTVNPMGRAAVDFLEGAASGAASTVFHGGDMIRRGLGMERVIGNPDVQQAMRAPDSFAGKAGRFGEQAAEMAIPAGAVGRGIKAAGLGRAVGVAGDVAVTTGVTGLQTGGDPTAMKTAAVVSGGIGSLAAGLGAKSPAVAKTLKESAEKQYGQVINATKQGNKWISQNVVVPELLDRGVKAFTLKGLLKKAEDKAAFFGRAIGAEWDALPAGTKTELDPIISRMTKEATDALTISTPGGAKPVTEYAKRALDQMEFLKNTLQDVAEVNPQTGVSEVPVEKLRQLRQAWDEVAAQAKVFQGQQLADHAAGKVHAMASGAIREQLAADFPNIAAINKEYSFWKNVKKVVGDTVLRREGQAKPMSQQIAAAGGLAIGGATGGIHGAIAGKAALEGLQKAMASPAWRTVSAVYKNRLADSIAKGNTSATTYEIGKILKAMATEKATPLPAEPTLQPSLSPVQ